MLFKCKVCDEKNKRIALLEKQLNFMTHLATPSKSSQEVSFLERERDAILSGTDQPLIISEDELEADSLLTGMYDHSQVEVV